LSKAIRGLSRLQSASVSFIKCDNIEDIDLQNLIESFENMKSLRNLNVDFSECERINSYSLHKALSKLPFVLDLELSFAGCNKITGLYCLSQALNRVTCLRSIHLDFSECEKIGYKAIESLCESFKSLGDLEKINLKFRNCGITEGEQENLQKIFEGFTPCLKEISLDLS